jgi:hypothetical protein
VCAQNTAHQRECRAGEQGCVSPLSFFLFHLISSPPTQPRELPALSIRSSSQPVGIFGSEGVAGYCVRCPFLTPFFLFDIFRFTEFCLASPSSSLRPTTLVYRPRSSARSLQKAFNSRHERPHSLAIAQLLRVIELAWNPSVHVQGNIRLAYLHAPTAPLRLQKRLT